MLDLDLDLASGVAWGKSVKVKDEVPTSLCKLRRAKKAYRTCTLIAPASWLSAALVIANLQFTIGDVNIFTIEEFAGNSLLFYPSEHVSYARPRPRPCERGGLG